MRLYELDDVVDYFVILESTRSHRGMRKPLGLARNMHRFAKFARKIVHVVLDDAELLPLAHAAQTQTNADFWGIDQLQHFTLLEKAYKAAGGFRDDDIIMSTLGSMRAVFQIGWTLALADCYCRDALGTVVFLFVILNFGVCLRV